jgi:hypothetical protein
LGAARSRPWGQESRLRRIASQVAEVVPSPPLD